MPALGALLIFASVSTIKPREARSIWQTGWPSRLALVTTFLSTLSLPIQAAVGIGVALSALLYLNESSTDVSIVELVERPDGRIEEREPPKELPANSVTVLDVYGHLFYAGARTLERLLPRPPQQGQDRRPQHSAPQHPAVILRLRGRSTVGATLVDVLSNYAGGLKDVGGRLYLTGISEKARDQMVRTGKLSLSGPVQIYEATPIVGESTREAYADAQTWLVSLSGEGAESKESIEDVGGVEISPLKPTGGASAEKRGA
jgi:sulfate permease, SulP family